MSKKRDNFTKVINNQPSEYIPCGFWHHFILGADQFEGLERPELLDEAYEKHLQYYKKLNPDMMKLMNEGFFGYPPVMNNPLKTGKDLLQIKSVGPDHPWITEQVKHVKRLCDALKDEVYCFYNVFAPLQVIRIRFEFLDMDMSAFVQLAEKYPEEMLQAGLEIQKDLTILVGQLFDEADLDGIYYCVQNVQSPMYDFETYKKYIMPTELPLLNFANSKKDSNILHICGYAGHKNNLEFYKDYRAKIYNWAVHTEKVSLSDGKKYFNNACILGGFDNNPNTIIDKGSYEETRIYAQKLMKENSYPGYILGADCSVPNDINDNQLEEICKVCHENNER